MPYIAQEVRDELLHEGAVAETTGELNYMITALLVNYMSTHNLSYSAINDVLGALEGAKLEFYRRVAVPYEDTKRQENGDVYHGY